jgi:hypothetical protein
MPPRDKDFRADSPEHEESALLKSSPKERRESETLARIDKLEKVTAQLLESFQRIETKLRDIVAKVKE